MWATGGDTPSAPTALEAVSQPGEPVGLRWACTCRLEPLLAEAAQQSFTFVPTLNTGESISVAVLPPGGLVLALRLSWCPENSQGCPQAELSLHQNGVLQLQPSIIFLSLKCTEPSLRAEILHTCTGENAGIKQNLYLGKNPLRWQSRFKKQPTFTIL